MEPTARRRPAAAAEDHVPRRHREAQSARRGDARACVRGTHSDAVFGNGTLDVSRYGHVLQARRLVGVRGAGEAFDGLHYVSSVTSTMRRGDFTQSFSLARNGLLSTLPAVPA